MNKSSPKSKTTLFASSSVDIDRIDYESDGVTCQAVVTAFVTKIGNDDLIQLTLTVTGPNGFSDSKDITPPTAGSNTFDPIDDIEDGESYTYDVELTFKAEDNDTASKTRVADCP